MTDTTFVAQGCPAVFLRHHTLTEARGQSFRHTTVAGRDYRFQTSDYLSGWISDGARTFGTGDDVVRTSGSLGLPADRGFTRVEVLSEAESAP